MLTRILPVSLLALTVSLSTTAAFARDGAEVAPPASQDHLNGDHLRAAAPCIFLLVLQLMKKEAPADFELPRLRLEHETPLVDFQDAVEPGWGMRPDAFTNVYTPASHQIFLLTEKRFYRAPRTAYDSLAHELTHTVQVKILGIPLEWFGDSEEGQAVDVQTRFREQYGFLISENGFRCPL